MKFLYFFPTIIILFSGCTLSKEELLQSQEDEKIDLRLDYSIIGDNSEQDYYLIVLKDTISLYDQEPLYSGVSKQLLLSKNDLQEGFWILLKKWSSDDYVYESEPVFISFPIPENSLTADLKLEEGIPVSKRKAVCEINNVSFYVRDRYENVPWDANYLDDAVSGSLPDVYFKIENFFSTGYKDFVDQPLGKITYNFNKIIVPSSFPTIHLECYDYDFNVSSDDLIFSTIFYINPVKYQESVIDNGISKNISLYSFYANSISRLTIKKY